MNRTTNFSDCKCGVNSFSLNQMQTLIIQTLFTISIFNIMIPNCLQVAIILKTSQFRVTSIYLALNLAICDLCLTLSGLIPQTYVLTYRIYCVLGIITTILQCFFFNLSKCLVVVISYDWYLHIKSPNGYSQIVTTKRLTFLMIMCFLAALSITTLQVNHKFVSLELPLLTTISLVITITVITYFYVRSIKLLHEHRLRRTALLQKDIKITELAKYILLIFACFHVTSCIIQVISVIANTRWRDFIFLLSQILLIHYSTVNAMCFFFVNRKSKTYLKNLYIRYFKIIPVDSTVQEPVPFILNSSQNKFVQQFWINCRSLWFCVYMCVRVLGV